jgi:hypothetical protein
MAQPGKKYQLSARHYFANGSVGIKIPDTKDRDASLSDAANWQMPTGVHFAQAK